MLLIHVPLVQSPQLIVAPLQPVGIVPHELESQVLGIQTLGEGEGVIEGAADTLRELERDLELELDKDRVEDEEILVEEEREILELKERELEGELEGVVEGRMDEGLEVGVFVLLVEIVLEAVLVDVAEALAVLVVEPGALELEADIDAERVKDWVVEMLGVRLVEIRLVEETPGERSGVPPGLPEVRGVLLELLCT